MVPVVPAGSVQMGSRDELRKSNAGGMRRALALVGAAAVVVACSSPPVEVPDFVGMSFDEAQSVARGVRLDLEYVDASGQDRVVLSAQNWTVDAQEPEAGASVERRSTVTVTVTNVRDTEPDPEPESEPEPEPVDDFIERFEAMAQEGFDTYLGLADPVSISDAIARSDVDAIHRYEIQSMIGSITGYRDAGGTPIIQTPHYPGDVLVLRNAEVVAETVCLIAISNTLALADEISPWIEVASPQGQRLARCQHGRGVM